MSSTTDHTPSVSLSHHSSGKGPLISTSVPTAFVPTTESTPQPRSEVKKDLKQVMVTTIDVNQVIAGLRDIVATGDYKEQLLNKILLNLIDIGGQPGFLEMFPSLSKGPDIFLVFFRLDKDLDEPCEVSYERDGNKITPYDAVFTICGTLSQILSGISTTM